MSDTTGPDSVETTANEPIVPAPLELADQSPLVATAPAAPAKNNSTRTILEIVGGVVAVGLIIVSGVVGFAVGHFTSNDNDRGRGISSHADGQFGDDQHMMRDQRQGQGQGQDMMPGWGQQGVDPRGIDPDGDNWTGGGQGTTPTVPQSGSSASPSAGA